MATLDQAFVDEIFPAQRTDDFFDALFGGAEEGAYDIRLVCRNVTPVRAQLAFELRQRPGKCLVCNLTYGLPQVFQRHPVLNVAGVAKAVADVIHRLHPEIEVKTVAAEGLNECRQMLRIARTGKYDGYLLEGMACPGGCIAGAGTLRPIEQSHKEVEAFSSEAKFTCANDTPYMDYLPLIEEKDKIRKL